MSRPDRIWFTSDLHLGHEKVIGFCNRPFTSAKFMDDILIQNYNAKVWPDEPVYFLGDVCFHKPSVGVPMLYRLRGRKILIRGNHDKYSDRQYRAAGFDSILEEAKIKIQGQHFVLSHYPYEPSDKSGMDAHDLRYLDRRPMDRGSWLLCGHVHDRWKSQGRMINVGVDVWNYCPVSGSDIMKAVSQSTLNNVVA